MICGVLVEAYMKLIIETNKVKGRMMADEMFEDEINNIAYDRDLLEQMIKDYVQFTSNKQERLASRRYRQFMRNSSRVLDLCVYYDYEDLVFYLLDELHVWPGDTFCDYLVNHPERKCLIDVILYCIRHGLVHPNYCGTYGDGLGDFLSIPLRAERWDQVEDLMREGVAFVPEHHFNLNLNKNMQKMRETLDEYRISNRAKVLDRVSDWIDQQLLKQPYTI